MSVPLADETIVLVLEGRVQHDKRSELEAFMREARPYYESMGNVTMRFMWHADDPDRFREVFEYRTRQAYLLDDQRVKDDPEMRAYLDRWRSFLDGEISISVWHEVGF